MNQSFIHNRVYLNIKKLKSRKWNEFYNVRDPKDFKNVLDFFLGYSLLCRKLTWKTHPPMGRSNFKMRISKIWKKIQILLKKVCTQTAFLFSIFWWEHSKKCKWMMKIEGKLNYFQKLLSFAFLTMFPSEYWKMENSLCTYFFERNLNLLSDFKNSHFRFWPSHREDEFFRVISDK